MNTSDPVRYGTGEGYFSAMDLIVPGGGLFGQARMYGSMTSGAPSLRIGNNWWVKAIPSMLAVGSQQLKVIFDPQHILFLPAVRLGDEDALLSVANLHTGRGHDAQDLHLHALLRRADRNRRFQQP